jgi:DNA polymerase-1
MKKLLLIDSNALIHRSYHALPRLTDPKGRLVNAVYGFASVLLKVLKELKPKYVVAAFDLAAPTFRHKMFKDYKATRIKAPQELYDQIPLVKELLKAFSIPIIEKKGYEADDIIGTITKRVKDQGPGIETIILTGDLDVLQLVDKRTRVYTPKRGISEPIIYDEAKIKERYGLCPKQIVDFKALKGDSSDNIPGVPGIGEKTAIDLLKKYKSIEEIYEHLDEIKESTRKKLEDNEEQAFFSKKLATINNHTPIRFNLDKCLIIKYNKKKVIDLFKELGFRSLLNRLN